MFSRAERRTRARIHARREVYDFTLLPRAMHCQNVLRSRLYRARFNILSAFNRTGIRAATTGGPINRHTAALPVHAAGGFTSPFADISGPYLRY